MLPRSRSLLVFVYVALVGAGVLFTIAPIPAIEAVLYPSRRSLAWSGSYVVGGLVALSALVLRLRMPNLLATWFFELGGLALLVSANLTYFVVLLRMAWPDTPGVPYEFGLLGLALVVLAFGLSLTVRATEALEHVLIVRQLERREDERAAERETGA